MSSFPKIKLVGVLNITPDRFSDGGKYFEPNEALARGDILIGEGADILDIGGDSSGPSSICVGPEEEWRRIKPAVFAFGPKITVSVDTHHPEIAERALQSGATIINDISCGENDTTLELVQKHSASIVLMFSHSKVPHVFYGAPARPTVNEIIDSLGEAIRRAQESGVSKDKIIADPGMGAFLSSDPDISWKLLEDFKKLEVLKTSLMLGISRKGFLQTVWKGPAITRDSISAFVAILAIQGMPADVTVYVRVHNVAIHKSFLVAMAKFR